MKAYWKTIYGLLIVVAFIVIVFVISLYQLKASESFSLERIFSTENIIETAIVFIACIVLVLLFSKKND